MVVSDNGPQFRAETYKRFAEEYGFKHVTSSPYYPQGNGEAERAVGTVKRLLEKEKDLALLAYQSTPLQNAIGSFYNLCVMLFLYQKGVRVFSG